MTLNVGYAASPTLSLQVLLPEHERAGHAAEASFLIGVLWFDLMFDVQAGRPGAVLAPDVGPT
ncbi:MAG TPA: hypothetical protein VN694_14845 [Caulobacteraceae bacterium]|nr:hypothetical protein [Caulobacteraceae bacterium]